jgi:cytochrome b involved in lipid metabolism
MSSALPQYTWEEIRRHNNDKDCWVVLYGNVLDVTKWLNHHPGGLDPINDLGGYDITKSFESIGHTEFALKRANEHIIGKLDPKSQEPVVQRKNVKQVSMEELKNFKLSDDPFANVKRYFLAFLALIVALYFAQSYLM